MLAPGIRKMRDALKMVMWSAIALGAVAALGLTIEWRRQRNLRAWANELDGTFEAGGVLSGVPVPEGQDFTVHGASGTTTYHNVVRLERGGARYVAATCYRPAPTSKSKASSDLVVFVTFSEADFPEVGLSRPLSAEMQKMLARAGVRAAPSSLKVPEALGRFAEAYEVRPLTDSAPPAPAALAAFLSAPVQEELCRASAILSDLQVRGRVVRFRASKQPSLSSYKETLDLAERVVALWRR